MYNIYQLCVVLKCHHLPLKCEKIYLPDCFVDLVILRPHVQVLYNSVQFHSIDGSNVVTVTQYRAGIGPLPIVTACVVPKSYTSKRYRASTGPLSMIDL